MKRLLFLFTVIALVACGKESPKAGFEVPEAVTKKFADQFPNAEKVRWEKEGKYFEAEFVDAGTELEVVYDLNGAVVLTETGMAASALPEKITQYLAENHAGLPVAEAERIVMGESVRYEVALDDNGRERELLFNEAGELLEDVVSEDEASDDDSEDSSDDSGSSEDSGDTND